MLAARSFFEDYIISIYQYIIWLFEYMHHVAAFSFGESLSSPTKEWDDIRALLLATEEGRIKVAGEHTHEEHQAM